MTMDTYKCPDYKCMEIYAVKSGDTLYAISQAYSVPVATLMQVNRILNPYNLKIGQKICIPGDGTPSMPVCKGTRYTVGRGDTLYMIARKYGVTLDALMKANPKMDPYNLKVGNTICIPAVPAAPGPGPVPLPTPGLPNPNPLPSPGPGPMPLPTPSLPSCKNGRAYMTQRGDTLTRIMERFCLTYGELLSANPDVDFEQSLQGMTLCIPYRDGDQNCIGMRSYTVVPGDSLDSISGRFKEVGDRLLIANPDLTVVDFSIPGTVICIPR